MIQLTIVSFILCGLVVMIKGKCKPKASEVADKLTDSIGFGIFAGGLGIMALLPVVLPVLFWIAVVKFIFF